MLADAIGQLYRDQDLRNSLSAAGLLDVEQFEMNRVATGFLSKISAVAPVFERNALAARREEAIVESHHLTT
jgi:hypothetical protein